MATRTRRPPVACTRVLAGALAVAAMALPSLAIAQDQPVNPDVDLLFAGEDLLAAFLLVGLTMAMHGVGMVITMRAHQRLSGWADRFRSMLAGLIPLVLASWMILICHLLELVVWTLFIRWQRAIPDLSDAFYFSILEYTTVGSRFTLPFRWRGLEGALAIGGLLTFAWSTGVLVTIGMEFQRRELSRRQPG